MSPSTAFLEALAKRRSIYALKKESPISDARIQEILTEIIKHVPSSFNSQTTRVVLLVGAEHDKLWDLHKDVLKPIVPEAQWSSTDAKIDMFKGAYATVLFFNHVPTTDGMQAQFPLYADRFPGWAAESNAMHQVAAWTALELEGLGANLQHYNPLIDEKIYESWGVSEDWKLQAELVIGTPVAPAKLKEFKPIEGERLLTFGTKN